MGFFKSLIQGREKIAAEAQAPGVPSHFEVDPYSVFAEGSAGDVKIYAVPERTAAMIMAIVADTTEIPVGKLRFNYIREIKSEG